MFVPRENGSPPSTPRVLRLRRQRVQSCRLGRCTVQCSGLATMATRDRPVKVAVVGTGCAVASAPSSFPSCANRRRSLIASCSASLAGLSTAYLLSHYKALGPSGRPLRFEVHLFDRVSPPRLSYVVFASRTDPPLSVSAQSDSIGMDTASLSIKSDSETFRVDVPMRSINGGEPPSLHAACPRPTSCSRTQRIVPPRCFNRLSWTSPQTVSTPRRAPPPLRFLLLVLAPRARFSFVVLLLDRVVPRHTSKSRRVNPADAASRVLGSGRHVEATDPQRRRQTGTALAAGSTFPIHLVAVLGRIGTPVATATASSSFQCGIATDADLLRCGDGSARRRVPVPPRARLLLRLARARPPRIDPHSISAHANRATRALARSGQRRGGSPRDILRCAQGTAAVG